MNFDGVVDGPGIVVETAEREVRDFTFNVLSSNLSIPCKLVPFQKDNATPGVNGGIVNLEARVFFENLAVSFFRFLLLILRRNFRMSSKSCGSFENLSAESRVENEKRKQTNFRKRLLPPN